MTCSRSQQIDLLGFLEAPRRPDFDDFRDHYPRCAACAAEVRAWTELQLELRAQRPGALHPEPEMLLAYAEARDGIATPERNALATHLQGCPTCRDELRALGAWSPDVVPVRSPWRRVLASLTRVTWHPAFAYALVGLLLFPVLYRAFSPAVDPAGELAARTETARAPRAVAPAPAEVPAPLGATGGALPSETLARAEPAEAFRPSGASAPEPTESEAVAPSGPPAARVLADQAEGGLRQRQQEVRYAAKSAGVEPSIDEAAAEPSLAAAEGAQERAVSGEAGRANLQAAPLVVRSVSPPQAGADRGADSALRAPAAPTPAVLLDAVRPVRLEPRRSAAGLTLRLPLPEPADSDGADVSLELAEAAGPRALRASLRLEAGASAVEVDVPPLWLVPGQYRVSVRETRGRFAADFRIEVTSR